MVPSLWYRWHCVTCTGQVSFASNVQADLSVDGPCAAIRCGRSSTSPTRFVAEPETRLVHGIEKCGLRPKKKAAHKKTV